MLKRMRIDPKGTIGQYPALLVRRILRRLRSRLCWGLAELEAAAGLTPGDGRALLKVLRSEGLIEAAGRAAWEVSQAGRTLTSATEAERLSDVDVAVELASREADCDRARVKNYERVEKMAAEGHRFRNFLEQEGCWYWEVFGFLKGRSRVIALADYATEQPFVLTVPHRVLFGNPKTSSSAPNPGTPQRPVRKRRPRDCPF